METYVRVWLILIVLTGLAVSTAGMDIGKGGLVLALFIAFVKSGLILNYFMHLREGKKIRLIRWMIPGILALLVLFIGITFLDIALR
ncbi:MAG: cytochrome C oxidase subunit IV family protein [Desulfobacterota bacterium]|nr:cytochrome C oxidase subunit IV family protein [Thermodesulfobacteriota bacterium]